MSFTSYQANLQLALAQAERSADAVGQALVQGVAQQLQSATRELHDSAHALALVLRGIDAAPALAAAVRERLVRVAQDIAMQREALLRRSAVVELSLRSLVPQSQPATYAGALGRYGGAAGKGAAFRTF